MGKWNTAVTIIHHHTLALRSNRPKEIVRFHMGGVVRRYAVQEKKILGFSNVKFN
jgi:hypothetical protein